MLYNSVFDFMKQYMYSNSRMVGIRTNSCVGIHSLKDDKECTGIGIVLVIFLI